MFLSESTLVKIIKEEMVKAIREQEEEPAAKTAPAKVAEAWESKIKILKSGFEVKRPAIKGRIQFEFTLAPAVKPDGTVSTIVAKVENIVFDKTTAIPSDLQTSISKTKLLRVSDVPEGRYTVTIILKKIN